jgi:hypothetical protein
MGAKEEVKSRLALLPKLEASRSSPLLEELPPVDCLWSNGDFPL